MHVTYLCSSLAEGSSVAVFGCSAIGLGVISTAAKRIQGVIPCLHHMGLSMLLSHRVVKLERSQTGTSHEQKSDILDIFDIVLVGVL
jgi:hypothetical protein